jgi:hypothetical protein
MAIAVDLLPTRPANQQELLAGPGPLLATAVEKRQRGNARTDAAPFARVSLKPLESPVHQLVVGDHYVCAAQNVGLMGQRPHLRPTDVSSSHH